MGQSKNFRECTCDRCRGMCELFPCMPLPREARALIDAGFSNRLMTHEKWGGGPNEIEFLLPNLEILGDQGDKYNRPYGKGRCTFLTEDGLCELHELELKPLEGRIVIHGMKETHPVHWRILETWDKSEPQRLVREWKNGSA